jgi:hypothetical protein
MSVHEGEADDARITTVSSTSQTYAALVWSALSS